MRGNCDNPIRIDHRDVLPQRTVTPLQRVTTAPRLFDMREARHQSEMAAPPTEWRHFRFWALLIVIAFALAVLAAIQ